MIIRKKILAVDDTPQNLDILVDILHMYDVVDVLDGKSAIEILEEQQIDLILLDIMMPDMDGFEVCKIVQQNPKTKDIPIIFITAMSDEESIEKAYDIGGRDYVTKPFKPNELLARVKTQLQLKEIMQNLQFIAYHDTMTGIFNRRRFFEYGTKIFDECDNLYFAMIDIDHFKKINDTYGHAAGDLAIMQCAKIISNELDEKTIFGRIGGEEFALLLNSSDDKEAVDIIESFREKIAKTPVPYGLEQIFYTFSCGIAKKNTNIDTIDEFLKIADECLYEAKQNGRNQIKYKF